MGLRRPVEAIRGRGDATDEGAEGLRFAVLGDSFTAGAGDPPEVTWPDRVARWLRAAYSPLSYENFAFDGATSEDVLEQVDSALELRPDLVTVFCGANDVLKSVRPDVEGYSVRLTAILDQLRGGLPRAAILTATSPEYWRFADLRPRTQKRLNSGITRLNEATRSIARDRSVEYIDAARHPLLDQRENFAPDGFHPSPKGHARAAIVIAQTVWERFGIGTKPTQGER